MSSFKLCLDRVYPVPRENAFALFSDHARFGSLWSGQFQRIRDASRGDDPNGFGSIREIVLPIPGLRIEETVTRFEPPALIEYRVTRGGPVKNHLGRITFTPVPDGTRVRYTIRFDPRLPGTGLLLASTLRLGLKQAGHRAAKILKSDP
jgi:uncharacterized protein YndB with AHSA1/START domain